MSLTLSTAARNARVDALVDLVDGGSGAGKVRIYDGSRPAGPGTAVSGQTLLAELTFTDPAFGAGSSGVATASSITSDSSADATGTASWARILDSNNVAVWDCSVGTSGSDINLSSVSIVAGGTVSITSWTVTDPAS
jgi:hypothetical protein